MRCPNADPAPAGNFCRKGKGFTARFLSGLVALALGFVLSSGPVFAEPSSVFEGGMLPMPKPQQGKGVYVPTIFDVDVLFLGTKFSQSGLDDGADIVAVRRKLIDLLVSATHYSHGYGELTEGIGYMETEKPAFRKAISCLTERINRYLDPVSGKWNEGVAGSAPFVTLDGKVVSLTNAIKSTNSLVDGGLLNQNGIGGLPVIVRFKPLEGSYDIVDANGNLIPVKSAMVVGTFGGIQEKPTAKLYIVAEYGGGTSYTLMGVDLGGAYTQSDPTRLVGTVSVTLAPELTNVPHKNLRRALEAFHVSSSRIDDFLDGKPILQAPPKLAALASAAKAEVPATSNKETVRCP